MRVIYLRDEPGFYRVYVSSAPCDESIPVADIADHGPTGSDLRWRVYMPMEDPKVAEVIRCRTLAESKAAIEARLLRAIRGACR